MVMKQSFGSVLPALPQPISRGVKFYKRKGTQSLFGWSESTSGPTRLSTAQFVGVYMDVLHAIKQTVLLFLGLPVTLL